MNEFSLPVLTIWEPFKMQRSLTKYMIGNKFNTDFTFTKQIKDLFVDRNSISQWFDIVIIIL